MPQMSPMWWFNLFFMFAFCMLIMNSMIYFNIYMMNESNKKFNQSNFYWKW